MTAAPAPAADRRAQVEQVLGEILRLAEWPARLETKDAADGGIAVAVHFKGEVPGVGSGKKSYLVESLQFLVNKVVNRPGVEKRWVTLGVGAFPEPKPAPQPSQPQQPQPSAPKPRHSAPPPPKASAPREDAEGDVAVSPDWAVIGKELSAKAVKLGRPYAVMMLSGSDRAQLSQASASAGLKVRAEGEGHFRRVALVPDKLNAMPRKMQFPDDEEEDDEG